MKFTGFKFKRLKIGGKLRLGFGIVVVLLVITGLAGIYTMFRISANSETIIETQHLMEAMDHAEEAVALIRLELGHYIFSHRETHLQEAEAARQQYRENWGVVKAHMIAEPHHTPEEIATIEQGYQTWDNKVKEALAIYSANPEDLAPVMAKLGEADNYFDDSLEPFIEEVHEDFLGHIAAVDASTNRLTKAMTMLMIVTSVLALILAMAFAYGISRGITGAVTHLTSAAASMSRGDLDVPIEVKTGDEIETLGEAIERMRESLKAAFERLRAA